jgi:hypothetical protein
MPKLRKATANAEGQMVRSLWDLAEKLVSPFLLFIIVYPSSNSLVYSSVLTISILL